MGGAYQEPMTTKPISQVERKRALLPVSRPVSNSVIVFDGPAGVRELIMNYHEVKMILTIVKEVFLYWELFNF